MIALFEIVSEPEARKTAPPKLIRQAARRGCADIVAEIASSSSTEALVMNKAPPRPSRRTDKRSVKSRPAGRGVGIQVYRFQ
jgi:hypothetical protein